MQVVKISLLPDIPWRRCAGSGLPNTRPGLVADRYPGHLRGFLSGTVSIVGHETRHTEDVVAQPREICRNLAAVLQGTCNNPGQQDDPGIMMSALRVYLRHPGNSTAIRRVLEQFLDIPGRLSI